MNYPEEVIHHSMSHEELLAEIDRRPSETEGDLKWAALLYAAYHRQGKKLSWKQRDILERILIRCERAKHERNPPDTPNVSLCDGHDEMGKP